MPTPLLNRFANRSVCKLALAAACASSLALTGAHAAPGQIKNVIYILLENRNFTYGTDTSGGAQIVGSVAAPYLNSLITPGSGTSAQVSYCTAYHNDLSTPSGANSSIHPSEPNYVWMESGNNLSKLDDNDPYGSGKSVAQINNYLIANPSVSGQHLTGLLQAAGITWKSYQEGIDLQTTAGANSNLGTANNLTNTVSPTSAWTVPLQSFSGTSTSYVNPYNGSHQFNFACKHNGSLFYLDTNGSTITTANFANSNPVTANYAPLEQFQTDLTNNTLAQYTIITPDQYNDMHTALTGGFTYNGTAFTGDLAQIAQGDNFCSIVVPRIMASTNYQAGNTAIVIWTDETEGTNQNDFNHTLTEIVISPLAKGNAYASPVNMTHSSDIATMQEIFQVVANSPTGYLNDAANVSNSSGGLTGTGFGSATGQDMSDLFQAGVIPSTLPILRVAPAAYVINGRKNTAVQSITVTNATASAVTNPVYIVVENSNATVTNTGVQVTQNTAPGSQYVVVSNSGIPANGSATVNLQFNMPSGGAAISNTLVPISAAGQP